MKLHQQMHLVMWSSR